MGELDENSQPVELWPDADGDGHYDVKVGEPVLGCVGLVLGFRSSSALASAYGIAVTATMAITTLLFFKVVQSRFGWSATKAVLVLMPLLAVDLAFFAANVPKIPHGGWLPLVIGFGWWFR